MRSVVEGAWASLSVYESPGLVGRMTGERARGDCDEAKARDICAHFSQGREFFRGASDASELVRPLLLYYGAVALARGAVLFLDSTKPRIQAGHGLDTPGWGASLGTGEGLAGCEVRVGSGGTFAELARVTANAEWIRVQAEQSPHVADAKSPGSILVAGETFTVKEVLGQIPDVAALYERTFSEHSRRLRSEVLYTGRPEDRKVGEEIPPDREVRGHSLLGILRANPALGFPDEGWAEALIESAGLGSLGPTLQEGFLYFARFPAQAPVGRIHALYSEAGSRNEPRLTMPVVASASGAEYLKLPTDGGVVLSTLLALHLFAHATATLVRYHPGYWAMLVGKTKGDELWPVLSAVVSLVEERYPALILDAVGG